MLKYFLILSLSVYIAESKTVCYGDLGCFSDSYPFWCFPQRPLSTLPDPPEKIATKFTLYNRHGATKGHVIRYDFIGDEYDPKKETKFIVHGFLENAVKPWVLEMKDALLKSGDINVITIDWSKGNGPLYTQATANTQVVGRETARLINHMIEHKNAHSSSFHIIGHSLGSHIAGYAGENVVRLGRITGLDPAGPYFENTDPIVRLDPTDAVVVDAIHSDGTANLLLGLGMMQPVGHADYYPNGGKDQPNCPATSGKILGAIFGALILDVDYISDTTACSHMAAVHFFTDSIKNKCKYHSYQCKSENDFNNGDCIHCKGSECNRMGHWSTPHHDQGTLYLNTKSSIQHKDEFCLQNFGVSLHSGKVDKQNKAYGEFKIFLESARSERSTVEFIDDYDQTFYANSIETRLISFSTHFLHEIEHVYISYKRTGNWFTWWLYDDKWAFTYVTLHNGHNQHTYKFCPTTTYINSGQTVPFKKC